MEKYLNDAIIGNKNIKASYSKNGELLRISYPNIDFRQFIEFFHTGVTINQSGIIYLHKDINNIYSQHYIEDTNILQTEIKNLYFNLKIKQTDFAPINHNLIIKKYEFINENNIDLDIDFLIHSKMITNPNNFIGAMKLEEGLMQYNHDYSIITFSNEKINAHQIHNTKENISTGNLYDKDYIGMTADSSISYNIGKIEPNNKKTIYIYIYIHENNTKHKIDDIKNEINKIKRLDVEEELNKTKKYWIKNLNNYSNILFKENVFYDKIQKIYNRTILLYLLLQNENTGGISASMEIDEGFSRCGRYSYCWPRDAVFITKALDLLKMEDKSEMFYKNFCKNTQSKSGMWEQRFFTDGRLAPCWGYQIDETASVVYGIYDHYTRTKDKTFLRDNLKMIEKATEFLLKYINDLIQNKNQMQKSYDIWEMYEGDSLYSLSSIYSAFKSMLEIYKVLEDDFKQNRIKQEKIIKQKEILSDQIIKIKEYAIQKFYDYDKNSFVRNSEDKKMDISILGAIVPFNMLNANDKKVKNTVEKINLTLRTYTGGYLRFENDHYSENKYPWVIATLWMSLYYLEVKEYEKAKECFYFVVNTCNMHGFLAEQIDNSKLEPKWVIGLGWSHAMFIIVLNKLIELQII